MEEGKGYIICNKRYKCDNGDNGDNFVSRS